MRNIQGNVIERLEKETLRAFDKIVDAGLNKTNRSWENTKNEIKRTISDYYVGAFGSSTWNIVDATHSQVLTKIDLAVGVLLNRYHAESVGIVTRTLREIYREIALRHAWMIDQVTPPSYKAKLPPSPLLREAEGTYRGPDADTSWKVRWSAWSDAYRDALYQNLRLGALNESTVADARNEVEATRPGSPQSTMWDAFKRIMEHQTEVSFVMAAMDVVSANPDMGIEEVWQTRYYDRVCEICQSNQGLTREQADGDIPAHPNCGCYWRLVPKSWASLLRKGTDEEKAMARAMDAHGEVPNQMLVFNDDGKLVGSVVIKFEEWMGDHESAISGGVR